MLVRLVVYVLKPWLVCVEARVRVLYVTTPYLDSAYAAAATAVRFDDTIKNNRATRQYHNYVLSTSYER